MSVAQLYKTATMMVHPGKGLLAADESFGTIKKRFDEIDLPSTEENRRDYRELLFRTKQAMERRISGVILFDETIRQTAKDGTKLIQLIEESGAIPGIKVDMGAIRTPQHNGDMMTQGLDGLRARLAEYYKLGARFAKWRAVIEMGRGGDTTIPSHAATRQNTQALACYAALCQEANIVPIVEPEVLMGGDHDINRCYDITLHTLRLLYTDLYQAKVSLEGTILKPNMIVAGKSCPVQPSTEEIAEKTIKCFRNAVPAAVPGIVFLSGGQTSIQATQNLNTMNEYWKDQMPWPVSFSYGRALQKEAIQAWQGHAENIPAAQAAFAHRAEMNGQAQLGQWHMDMETPDLKVA